MTALLRIVVAVLVVFLPTLPNAFHHQQRLQWRTLSPRFGRSSMPGSLAATSTHPNGNPTSHNNEDPYDSFTFIDKILFSRFALSVAAEMDETTTAPRNYNELMALINKMTRTRPIPVVHDQGKNMLVRLFPKWLLVQYQWMFAKPFPRFSAWMNAYVTHWSTNWLMGNSTIYDLELADGTGVCVQY